MPIKVALAGFGVSGRYFHAPFLLSNKNFRLHSIWTSRSLDPRLFASCIRYDSYDELINDPEVDLVVIATPSSQHVSHAAMALNAGKHVVIEKPIASAPQEFLNLVAIGSKNGCELFPYQNRRWDADFLTVCSLVRSGKLGEICLFESSWPHFNPDSKSNKVWKLESVAINNVLYELGSHLLDQAIYLFGAPLSFECASLAVSSPQSPFALTLYYPDDLIVVLNVGFAEVVSSMRFSIIGTKGRFEKFELDPQETRLRAGLFPEVVCLGREDVENYGVFTNDGQEEIIPSMIGDYGEFYAAVWQTLKHKKSFPISSVDIALQLQILSDASATLDNT